MPRAFVDRKVITPRKRAAAKAAALFFGPPYQWRTPVWCRLTHAAWCLRQPAFDRGTEPPHALAPGRVSHLSRRWTRCLGRYDQCLLVCPIHSVGTDLGHYANHEEFGPRAWGGTVVILVGLAFFQWGDQLGRLGMVIVPQRKGCDALDNGKP